MNMRYISEDHPLYLLVAEILLVLAILAVR